MPPKLRGQPEEGSEQEVGQGATEGSATAEITSSGGDGAITSLARMFESFMRSQRERDERRERDGASGTALQSPPASSQPDTAGF